jgi:Ca-activated chloride channel homolog
VCQDDAQLLDFEKRSFSMTRVRTVLAAGLAVLASVLVANGPAGAAQVQIDAGLGQGVLSEGTNDPVYLRLSLKALGGGDKAKRVPINVALVIDRSGSMAEDNRIAAARDAANVAIERLAPDDIVSLISYNHKVDVLHPAARLGASRDSLKRAIERLTPDGTTALYAGVKEGGQQVREFLSDNKVNRVVLVSDGLANVGPSSPSEVAGLGRELAGKGISVTTIGLGLDYNEDLMQRLAGASDGNHAFVESPAQLASIFDKEFGDALSVSARDIIIEIEIRNGFRPKRVLGRDADIQGNRIQLKMTQLQAENERYIVVELDPPKGLAVGTTDIADVDIGYLDLSTNQRVSEKRTVGARVSTDIKEADASINKPVMTQITEQIATEASEKAVELRDKGDMAGAKKSLEDNAAYLKSRKSVLGSGAGAAPETSLKKLEDLERKSNEAASNLDEENWGKTRKGMRADQHKSKSMQSY